jgi:hypothetical protein
MQLICERLDPFSERKPTAPRRWDCVFPVDRTGQLAIDGASCFGVVAEIDGEEGALLERGAPVERPERGLERMDDVPTAANLGRVLAPIGPLRDGRDFGNECLT